MHDCWPCTDEPTDQFNSGRRVAALAELHLLLDADVDRPVEDSCWRAATPIINKSLFGSLEISLPDRSIQIKIGDYLRSFDDLIENNQRRIEILEEVVRLLYQEWFVHFRFPGHEESDWIDSSLGRFPRVGARLA